MQTRTWALQDAKNKFSAVVDAAQRGEAQIVTRRGSPAAVVVSVALFEKLQKHEQLNMPSLIDHLLDMPSDDVRFESLNLNPREVNFGEPD